MPTLKTMPSLIIGLFALFFATACGIPGSPNAPVEDTSVTLKATVAAPEVNSDIILPSAKYSSAAVLDQIISQGNCSVNGKRVEFSLDRDTRKLQIDKVTPAEAYEILLKAGSLELRSVAPHSSRIIEVPGGVSLQTTAEYHLRQAYAAEQLMSVGAFADYKVADTIVAPVIAALQAELAKSGSAGLATTIDSQVKAVMAQKSFREVFARQGAAYNFSGNWQGQVGYFLHNAAGTPALVVMASATASISVSGSNASGNFRLVPVGVVPLLKDTSGLNTPGEIAFAFSGTSDGQMIRFTRQGRLGPLTGKNLDSWELFPINRGLACRAVNVDSAYNTGIKAMPGDFVLTQGK